MHLHCPLDGQKSLRIISVQIYKILKMHEFLATIERRAMCAFHFSSFGIATDMILNGTNWKINVRKKTDGICWYDIRRLQSVDQQKCSHMHESERAHILHVRVFFSWLVVFIILTANAMMSFGHSFLGVFKLDYARHKIKCY